ncbi:MAG: tetraacyldisaccharide 4'-kinase [Woeseiaceae bacterium]
MQTEDRWLGLRNWIYAVWYENGKGGWLLAPLEVLFRLIASARRGAYRVGIKRSTKVGAPVVVIGNLTVGGAGKTPLVGWYAREARRAGWQPAIISRGYGGAEPDEPLRVTRETPVEESGDEAAMLAQQTGLPVYICRHRVKAGLRAVSDGANIVFADDGLQHYALARDVEIVVVDAAKRFGNNHCLPWGPLREPASRLDSVDLVVMSGESTQTPGYTLDIEVAENAQSGKRVALSQFADTTVHAIAGIGHPQRFFSALVRFGLQVIPIAPGDHGVVDDSVLLDTDKTFLMTEKDAVKYNNLGRQHWIVPGHLKMTDASQEKLLSILPTREKS